MFSTGPRIYAAGAAHIDRRAISDSPYVPRASNPGRLVDCPGGSAFNAVQAMVQAGAGVSLHSARGGDPDGRRVTEAILALGVTDLSVTWLDRTTPTYTAVLDDKGELVAGIADMALYDLMVPRLFTRSAVRTAIARADGILVDANLPAASIAAVTGQAAGKPVAAIGVSPAKIGRLQDSLGGITALFLSYAEAASLVEATIGTSPQLIAELLSELGVQRAVVTDGPREAMILDGQTVLLQQPPTVVPKDITGAGDNLAGTAFAMLCAGTPFLDAVRAGIVAASLRISSEPTLLEELAHRIAEGVAALHEPRRPETAS
ncbi:carbohydrate kinase family protein [Aurantimonas sp. A2-1-M11]|uniref:carbohydrate kinase family protein n=1 Tax=Aurantimonas sp. A2-1-M11 TaxID=3113712 RepID=UPI002F91CECD